MKRILQFVNRTMTLQIALLLGLLIIAASCEKADSVFTSAPVKSEMKSAMALPPGDQSIAEIAIGAGFDELVAALFYVDEELGTGLVDLFLNGKDQYTVFAPTDEAFEALYGALGADEISDLQAGLVLNVLLYHVTEGRRAANSVVPKVRTIETLLSGATFSVDKNAKITAVGNTANITSANISASNGIIHVIDAVILPIVP